MLTIDDVFRIAASVKFPPGYGYLALESKPGEDLMCMRETHDGRPGWVFWVCTERSGAKLGIGVVARKDDDEVEIVAKIHSALELAQVIAGKHEAKWN